MAKFLLRCRLNQSTKLLSVAGRLRNLSEDSTPIHFPDFGPPIPEYVKKEEESLQTKRARLLYQSRTFAAKFMDNLDEKLLDQYDTLINQPSNDWEIYYWMTSTKPTPQEFDNDIMDMLKKHCQNEEMETRFHQPPLETNATSRPS